MTARSLPAWAADTQRQGLWQYQTGGDWVTIGSDTEAPRDGAAVLLPGGRHIYLPVTFEVGKNGCLL